jgi:NACHT domain
MTGRRGRDIGPVSQDAAAEDNAQITQVAGNQIGGDQHVHHYHLRSERASSGDTTAAKTALFHHVRAGESAVKSHLLGLDIVRPTAAKATYTVEHTTRFRAASADDQDVRTDILGFFRDVADRQLVILGPAGAGKSVLAVELILALLRDRPSGDPVPVRFDLAGWDPALGLGDWLAAQLAYRHGVPAAAAQALLYQREILPVLDGLDEISAEKEDLIAAVLAINTFLADRSDTGYVITCRNNVYSDIGRRIEPSREITILPLTTEEIASFIGGVTTGDTAAENAWEPVRAALQAGSPAVRQALSTPWRLILAITFFLDRGNTYELVPADGETSNTYARRVGDLLTRTYAPARARLHKIETRERADAWCRFIADDLDRQVARGSSRQDIIAHYSADRAWGTELLHRALAAATHYLRALFFLGVLTLGAWLVDAVSGTSIVSGLQTVLSTAARSRSAPFVGALAGLAIFAVLLPGVPRARKTTRRLLRAPGLTRKAEVLANVEGVALLPVGFLLSGGLIYIVIGAITFLVLWPMAGAQNALHVAAVAGLIPAIPVGIAAGLQNSTKHTFEVWHGQFLADGRERSLRAAHARGISANWTLPSEELDQVLGNSSVRRNWPAAVESFLAAGYEAGIFRRSGQVYQFRHRQLQDWYASPVHPLRAWDNELPLPADNDSNLVHRVNTVYGREGRAAAQRLVLHQKRGRERAAELRTSVAAAGERIRPRGALSQCDIHVLRALGAAESEARTTGSATIQPWHLLITLFADLEQRYPDCPAKIDQIRATFRPARTISPDDSPGHLPLARSLRAILTTAPGRWRQRIRAEFLVRDLLDGDDDSAHRAVLALRHPADTEAAVRAWLNARIDRLSGGENPDDTSSLTELAVVLAQDLARPAEAEIVLLEAVGGGPGRADLLLRLGRMGERDDLGAFAAVAYRLATRCGAAGL